MSTGNPWEEGVTADEAWQDLSSQPAKPVSPGLIAGAVMQVKKEIHIPTSEEVGASIVRTVAAALRTGEEEWSKITPTKVETPVEPKKPSVAVDVAKTLGTLALTAAAAATGNAWSRWQNRNQRGVTVYQQPVDVGGDPDIIDAEATDVE